MGVIAALSVKKLTANFSLSVFFLTGALANCPYVTDLHVSTPKKMEALSGSCLQIPCNFSAITEEELGQREIFGVWIKNNPYFGSLPQNVVYNSSGTVKIYPMNITGNLRQKQCTTLFSHINSTHEDVYYFRIDFSIFKATALCDPLQIRVRDSPHSPSMEIPGDLKEEESVTITCSALTPCPHSPPKLTWSLQRDSLNNMEENTDGTFTTKIQESITLSDHHDGYIINCSATYPVNEGRDVRTAEETKTLNVSYAPKNTSVSISLSDLVSAGTLVNLTCSSRAKPPVSSFTWFRISNNRHVNVSEGEFYSLNVTEGGVYYCVAISDLGNQTSSRIHLNIEEPAGGYSSGALLGGIIGSISLICLIVGIILALTLWGRFKSADSSQESLSQNTTELAVVEPKKQMEDEEGIHYGEIDFSKQRPSSDQVQDSGQQQETVYAQVKGSGSREATEGPEELYAQVKKD